VQADASRLPFTDATFRAIATIMTATDFDDLASVLIEARRVTVAGGPFVLVMAHPCFGQVFHDAGWRLERTEEDARTATVPILLGIRVRAADR
jgi:ubiquinone/menaquinone biosynthesis C-methylase UbiE